MPCSSRFTSKLFYVCLFRNRYVFQSVYLRVHIHTHSRQNDWRKLINTALFVTIRVLFGCLCECMRTAFKVKPIFSNSSQTDQASLVSLLWSIWPTLPQYGRKAAQFVDLLGYFTLKTPDIDTEVNRFILSTL